MNATIRIVYWNLLWVFNHSEKIILRNLRQQGAEILRLVSTKETPHQGLADMLEKAIFMEKTRIIPTNCHFGKWNLSLFHYKVLLYLLYIQQSQLINLVINENPLSMNSFSRCFCWEGHFMAERFWPSIVHTGDHQRKRKLVCNQLYFVLVREINFISVCEVN